MANLRYVGRSPDGDSVIAPKSYVDSSYASVKVDSTYVSSVIATYTANMVSPSYVDTQDSGLAKKTAVDAADATYLDTSARGSTVASIGSDGYVPSSQYPSTLTDRMPSYVLGTTSISAPVTSLTQTVKDQQVGTLTITDPGYPYQVLSFAYLQGAASAATAPSVRTTGTGVYGKAVILGPSDVIFGAGVSSGNYRQDHTLVVPYAAGSATASVLTGNITLDLWVSLWSTAQSGVGYTWIAANALFYAMVVPAI